MADRESVPAIPAWLSDMDTVGGLVVPWVTMATASGRHLFSAISHPHVRLAFERRLCSVCGRPLEDRLVLLMRLSDMPYRRSFEPAVHPVCASYTVKACPMIAGRLDHYRSVPLRLDDNMVSAPDVEARRGELAEPWFQVWLPGYEVIIHDGKLAASYAGIEPLRVRPVGKMAAMLLALGMIHAGALPDVEDGR